MIFKGFTLVFFILASVSVATALGISPAVKNIDFSPGGEVNIPFYVLDASEDSFYDVSFRGGDLVPYSSISADVVKGPGSFILTIRFPTSLDEPGEHTVSVSIKERASESAFFGTIVEVGSVIKVFSPYPGLYGELSLSVPDGNVDDKIPVELHVVNRGDQLLSLKEVYIDFISGEGNVVKTLNFTPVDISAPGDRYFRKYLETKDIEAGNYLALARISYADIVREVNQSFRVGSLFVNITNFTDSIVSDGVGKFYVSVENLWNSPIAGVYVDVNISNDLGEHYLFRTPSADLNPWEEKTIESYFDTENLEGLYNLILTAGYAGKSTVVYGTLLVTKKLNLLLYSIIALVVIILLFLIYFFIIRRFLRRRKGVK
ncbi:hypothetical protein J4416_01085 [Candidatus Pacearchaeota archaeon]|nr:hypothetical protein [Candidatus Pacearchaeota archaeon]HLC73143.1 hypothetical protein [Candidatus Nanoarchaeia archaeon]